jgi:predicted kinase
MGDQPLPFDAIEFDPMIAAGDVLYDLAFLLMDLVERKLERAANVVLNGYFGRAARIEDLDGLAALPFFMSLRASIRAKVTAARLPHADVAARPAIAAASQTYFRLALNLIEPPPPRLIAIGGLSGTGKTSVARELAPVVPPKPGALVLRSDVERKTLFGVAETEHLPVRAYHPEVTEAVYRRLAKKAARTIAAGHSVIVDAVFARSSERNAIAAVARSADVEFDAVFLVSDVRTRIARVSGRSLDASDADASVALEQEGYDLGQLDWTRVDASGSLPKTVERVHTAIG